jgi:hypothetical protein
MDVNYDYSAAFKGISVKLKKRFLRKPNVSDAIEEYTALSKQLESEECHGLAGYCLQQVAKCYHSVGNTVSESAALHTAAKQYLNSEISTTIEAGILTFNENLISAISLYEEAIRLHCDQNERQLAAKLCLELADILAQKFDKHFESIPYYERAFALFSTPNEPSSPLSAIFVLFKLASIKTFTCDYSGALSTYTDICNSILNKCLQSPVSTSTSKDDFLLNSQHNQMYNKPIGIYSYLLVEADISKLLLLLYLKPTKMKPEHSNTIEVYSWFQTLSNANTNYMPALLMDRDLFILLQSFVMSCQSNDLKLLNTLQTELWPLLNDVQNFLLNLITDQLLNSSYTDDLLFQ